MQQAVKVGSGLLQAHSAHSRSAAAQPLRKSGQEQLMLSMRQHIMQQLAAAETCCRPKFCPAGWAAAQLSAAVGCCNMYVEYLQL